MTSRQAGFASSGAFVAVAAMIPSSCSGKGQTAKRRAFWWHGLVRLVWGPGAFVLAASIVGIGDTVVAQPRTRTVGGGELHEVLPRDAIQALRMPRMVTVSAARAFMRDDEPVLAVIDRGDARCYSTWLLEAHEIVNDSLAGVPIAASW